MHKFSILIIALLAITISGCSVSNWNVGKTAKGDEEVATVETKPSSVATKEHNENNLHIDKIIEAWGSPTRETENSAGDKIYIYENCKATGVYVDKCDENGCQTIPEMNCCERELITDQNGYVQNLKDAINSCL
ncbi:MAG: hypothetical protein GXZ15_06065 [Campylobacter sp.]|nr:hypothetical protein [Campylobacter sp.]